MGPWYLRAEIPQYMTIFYSTLSSSSRLFALRDSRTWEYVRAVVFRLLWPSLFDISSKSSPASSSIVAWTRQSFPLLSIFYCRIWDRKSSSRTKANSLFFAGNCPNKLLGHPEYKGITGMAGNFGKRSSQEKEIKKRSHRFMWEL